MMTHSKEIEQLKNKHARDLTNLQTKSVEASRFIEQLEHKIQVLE
jgi:hypothetical protein